MFALKNVAAMKKECDAAADKAGMNVLSSL
jgi:hypothetical protein